MQILTKDDIHDIVWNGFFKNFFDYLYKDEVYKMSDEFMIVGIRKFKEKGFAELQLIRESEESVTPAYRVKTALVKLENVNNYGLREFVTIRYKKYGDKWFCFPSKESTKKPSNEFMSVTNLDELPF